MAKTPLVSKFPWQDLPLQTVKDTSTITGGSPGRVYALIGAGELEAIKLAGKTLVRTPSILALIERSGEPWKPNLKRVERAIAGRPDVARKRAEEDGCRR